MKNTEFNTNVEYQMKNRFIVEFPDEFKIPFYLVKGIDKPKYIPKFPLFDSESIWSNCTIKFNNPVSPNLSLLLFNIINKMDFEIKIKMLDPIGEIIEETKIFEKMKELFQIEEKGYSKEGENELIGFEYNDALVDYGEQSVKMNLEPIIKAFKFSFYSSLELGSGNGSFSWNIKQLYPNNIVCTADINKEASKIHYYKELNHFILRTDKPFLITENEKDSFKFDLILSFEHFEHIEPSKLDVLAQNLLNHSKKGTIFFGSAPSYSRGYNQAGLIHPNCKSQEEWDVWFKNLGFKKMSYSILNNRDLYGIPYEAYMNSNELFYQKI